MYAIPSLILLCVITFLLAKGAIRVLGKERESSLYLGKLEKKMAALVFRERTLQDGIARLQTEEGVKGEIKERFNVTQAGEHVAVIIDEKRVSSSTQDRVWPWYKKLLFAIMGSR